MLNSMIDLLTTTTVGVILAVSATLFPLTGTNESATVSEAPVSVTTAAQHVSVSGGVL